MHTGISSVQAQADSLLRPGHRARAITADVSDAQQDQQTVKAFGCLYIAVACAAVRYHDCDFTFDALDESVWEETHAVNLRGVMLTCKSFIGHMLGQESGGSIVMVSSVTARDGGSPNASYLTSKHGLNAYTGTLLWRAQYSL